MNNINTLRTWLNHPDRKGVVSIRELEKRINCPRSTLGQWLTGKRPLPQKWEKPLLQQIEKLDFKTAPMGQKLKKNMEKENTLFVAFSHKLTQSQIEGFGSQYGKFEIITLGAVAPELQSRMSAIPATATLCEIQELAKDIVGEAVKAEATHFFCTGEPTFAMWANLYASGRMQYDFGEQKELYSGLQNVVYNYSDGYMLELICIQSTTERKSVETTNPDGTVTKKQIFKHVQWREMF